MDESLFERNRHGTPHGALSTRVRVVAAVVWREGRLLFTQRPPGGPIGLQWEMPGGKIEPGESPEHAVIREIREELGVTARPREVLEVDTHDYPHGLEVEITFIHCELDSHDLKPAHGVHAFQWWTLDEVDLSRVLAGDRDFLAGLKSRRWRPEP